MKVFIVTGYGAELCTYNDAADFFNYLVKEVGIKKDDIFFYGPAEYEAKINFYNIFAQICKRSRNEDLIIYYSGHGLDNCWSLKDYAEIPYEVLAHFLQDRSAPLIFINDCCFGMAAVDFLKDLYCRKLIIGLAPKNLLGQSDDNVGSVLLPDLFSSWRKYTLAHPKFKIKKEDLPEEMRDIVNLKMLGASALRYGDEIDYILFPQKNMTQYVYRASQLILKIMQLVVELLRIFWCILKPS